MVWDAVTKPYHPLPRWAHWPKPFNVIRNVQVLACNNDTWLAEIEFYGAFAGELFWHIFVPTPTEITRKTIFGRYRCGLILELGEWSPMDLIWGRNTTRILAEIAEPFTRPIFYWWAADTALFTLNAWQSLIYAQESCGLDDSDVLMADGFAANAVATTQGSIPFWTVLHDNDNRVVENSGFIDARPGDGTVYAFAIVTNQKTVSVTIGWWIENSSVDESSMVITTLAPGETKNVRIIAQALGPPTPYQLRFNNQLGGWTLLGFIEYRGIRMGVSASTVNPSWPDKTPDGEEKPRPGLPCDNQMSLPTE